VGRLWYVIFVLLFLGVVYGIIFFIGFSLFTYLAVVAAIVEPFMDWQSTSLTAQRTNRKGKILTHKTNGMNLMSSALRPSKVLSTLENVHVLR